MATDLEAEVDFFKKTEREESTFPSMFSGSKQTGKDVFKVEAAWRGGVRC